MKTLATQNVLILGFGKSGQAAARYCAAHGAQVRVADARPGFDFTDTDLAALDGVDLVVVSPGVPHNAVLAEAERCRIPVVGELELGIREITAPIVAVTGTNGKSTTTALIGHLLQVGSQKICVAGNIGTALLDVIDAAKCADVVVLEVSSYQLETAPSLKPKVAVYLNLSADHLDRYRDMESYAAAKAKIFENQDATDVAVYNDDDALVMRAAQMSAGQKVPFDAQTKLPWTLADTTLTGAHNLENMTAAILAARALGVSDDAIGRGLKSFRGLPHRLEFVRELNGVKYFDDSKGTNIGAVVKSLAGFSEPVHLIAGGLGKGTRYTGLRPAIQQHVYTLILMGKDREVMREDLGDLAATYLVDSMQDAVTRACEVAQNGDVVLLSPACASFDMFKDYADRGSQFVQYVKELAA